MLHVMTPFGLFCRRSAPKAQLHRLAFNKKENQNAQFTKSHLDLCRLLAACISQSIHSILNVPLLIIPAPPYIRQHPPNLTLLFAVDIPKSKLPRNPFLIRIFTSSPPFTLSYHTM